MLASWLSYSILLGALLACAGHFVTAIATRRGLPSRFVWLIAIVAMVMIPVALSLRPTTTHATIPVFVSMHPVQPTTVPQSSDVPLTIAWLLASMLVAARIVASAVALRRKRSKWTRAAVGPTDVLIADELGPALIGFRRFVTIVPKWALALDAQSLELVLAHEAEHAKAGDPWLRSAALVATVVMPWNPAIWWSMRRLRLAVEMDCDRRVLRRGIDTRTYAAVLLTVGENMSRLPFAWATALGGPRSFLERRIVAMTPRPVRYPRLVVAALGVAAAGVIVVACGSPVPDPVVPPRVMSALTEKPNPANQHVRLHECVATTPCADTVVTSNGRIAVFVDARDIPSVGDTLTPKGRLRHARAMAQVEDSIAKVRKYGMPTANTGAHANGNQQPEHLQLQSIIVDDSMVQDSIAKVRKYGLPKRTTGVDTMYRVVPDHRPLSERRAGDSTVQYLIANVRKIGVPTVLTAAHPKVMSCTDAQREMKRKEIEVERAGGSGYAPRCME